MIMIVHYIGHLIAEAIPDDTAYWCIYEEYTVLTFAHRVVVPRWYVTDFASVPRLFWNIIPPMDPRIAWIAPAHDRCYETHELSRSDADDLLYWGMLAAGAGKLSAYAAWSAVRLFGASAYATGSDRRADRQKRADAIRLTHSPK
jgi:hypothetical protein